LLGSGHYMYRQANNKAGRSQVFCSPPQPHLTPSSACFYTGTTLPSTVYVECHMVRHTPSFTYPPPSQPLCRRRLPTPCTFVTHPALSCKQSCIGPTLLKLILFSTSSNP
jgi:hypothetical protein